MKTSGRAALADGRALFGGERGIAIAQKRRRNSLLLKGGAQAACPGEGDVFFRQRCRQRRAAIVAAVARIDHHGGAGVSHLRRSRSNRRGGSGRSWRQGRCGRGGGGLRADWRHGRDGDGAVLLAEGGHDRRAGVNQQLRHAIVLGKVRRADDLVVKGLGADGRNHRLARKDHAQLAGFGCDGGVHRGGKMQNQLSAARAAIRR